MFPAGRPQGSPLHILPPINRGRQCTCGSSAATMANRGPNHPRCARHARCSYSREYSIVTRYCTPTSSHVLEKFLLSAENTNFLPERCSHMIISPDICITVEDYLFALGDKSPNTRKSAKRLLRQFLDWCAREDEYDDLISPKTLRNIEVPKAEQKVMNIIGKEAFERLYAACEGTDFCKRNQAILCLLMDTGVRV